MGRGETAHPAIRRQPFVRLPSPLCGPLFTLPALRGGQGGDEPRPLAFCSAALRPLGLPTLALPMNGEGGNWPTGHTMALPALRTSIPPPRFAGRAGWGRTEASCVLLGCTEAFGPPHPGPPHEWGGGKLAHRSYDGPPRFADFYSPSPLCGEGRVGTNRGLLRFARLH